MSSAINLSGMFPGASPGLQDIIRQLQQAQNKANEANEKRYQDILGLYGNLGQAGMTRIGQAEQQGQAKATQDLTSRGLGNTTVTSAVSRGIASDAELARQSLQEGVAQQKAGVMERRTDQGPDMGMYANLLQQASQAGVQNQGAIIAENARRDAESRARYMEMMGGSSSAQSYTPSVSNQATTYEGPGWKGADYY